MYKLWHFFKGLIRITTSSAHWLLHYKRGKRSFFFFQICGSVKLIFLSLGLSLNSSKFNYFVTTGVLIGPYPDQEGNKLMFLSEWLNFLRRLALQKKKNLMTARVSMLLKSRASLTCFPACLLPGRAKDLSAPRYKTSHVR